LTGGIGVGESSWTLRVQDVVDEMNYAVCSEDVFGKSDINFGIKVCHELGPAGARMF
jgi:hypothetical protein